MEQIAITHGFVKKLAKNIRHKYGRDVRHTEIIELVADALGFKAGPLMHALKQQAGRECPEIEVAPTLGTVPPQRLPTGLVLRKAETDLSRIALPEGPKDALREFVEHQRKAREFRDAGLHPLNKILLVGKFKDSVAEAIATSLALPLFEVSYGALRSENPGEAVKHLREVFAYAAQQQCVLLLDDLDVIGMTRDDMGSTEDMKRIVSNLLVQLDDAPPNVIVVGGTLHPQLMDRAFLRRFQVRVNLSPPQSGIPRVAVIGGSEGLTTTQRKYVAFVEHEFSGERLLLVVKEYDKHPEVSAARVYLQRRGHSWERVEYCSLEAMAAVYETTKFWKD